MEKLTAKQAAALEALNQCRGPKGIAKLTTARWLGHDTATLNQLVKKGLATKAHGNCFAYFRHAQEQA